MTFQSVSVAKDVYLLPPNKENKTSLGRVVSSLIAITFEIFPVAMGFQKHRNI